VIINEQHKGLLYKDEVYDDAIRTGDRMRGYIKNIRPDNKIDVSPKGIKASNLMPI
jgi:predicted RNA-binding protein (virulence factor B family)